MKLAFAMFDIFYQNTKITFWDFNGFLPRFAFGFCSSFSPMASILLPNVAICELYNYVV